MVFRFRMLSDENDHFVRDYEVMYDTTLLEFHNFILDSLEYEPCMASFFTADDRWEKQREFTLMEMGDGSGEGPETMESIRLGQIIHNLRDRLIYLFDLFGDRAYYLELTGGLRGRPAGLLPARDLRRGRGPGPVRPLEEPRGRGRGFGLRGDDGRLQRLRGRRQLRR